ncbi:PAS domain S-box protein [Methanoregula sp.]|uniref:PAS domain S-box protein n=1 Tax=Methanoregula sp. TaxID=2052170 RepID=UPI00237535D2|nr:PAS domain S-box protein [Methanoregula sp.]MDD1685939.1 PAS domain S-box protein [Methanoregula sp.]
MPEKKGLIEGGAVGEAGPVDLFRTVFERIQTAILVIDPAAHRIVDVNPLMESLTGFGRDQLLGSTCHGFVCPARFGECPVTDLHRDTLNAEREIINANGKRVPVLKTVAKAEIGGREYLVESFTDITDRKRAEERQLALIAFLSESILRARKPLEIMQQDFEQLAAQAKSGDYDAEEIRMQLQVHANNLRQILTNIEDLQKKALEGRSDEIPPEFREFFKRT